MTAQDKKWQREEDARTLARAQEIMDNKPRLNGAVREAKVMAKQDEKRIAAMKKIAKKKVTKKKPVRRKPVRRK